MLEWLAVITVRAEARMQAEGLLTGLSEQPVIGK
jgi:hypothetical protein